MYDKRMGSIYAAEAPYTKAMNDALNVEDELLIFTWEKYGTNSAYSGKEFPLQTHNPQKIVFFFNKILSEKGWTQNYVNNMQANLPYTISLIELLKKEYSLD
jgi:hypothetical protein